MRVDFNALEQRARELVESSRWKEAMRIYLFMADGDPSLDAGYLGEKIAECYEALGDPHSARYWYGRAVEENPEVRTKSVAARKRLSGFGIDDLVPKRAFLDGHPSAAVEKREGPSI